MSLIFIVRRVFCTFPKCMSNKQKVIDKQLIRNKLYSITYSITWYSYMVQPRKQLCGRYTGAGACLGFFKGGFYWKVDAGVWGHSPQMLMTKKLQVVKSQ